MGLYRRHDPVPFKHPGGDLPKATGIVGQRRERGIEQHQQPAPGKAAGHPSMPATGDPGPNRGHRANSPRCNGSARGGPNQRPGNAPARGATVRDPAIAYPTAGRGGSAGPGKRCQGSFGPTQRPAQTTGAGGRSFKCPLWGRGDEKSPAGRICQRRGGKGQRGGELLF